MRCIQTGHGRFSEKLHCFQKKKQDVFCKDLIGGFKECIEVEAAVQSAVLDASRVGFGSDSDTRNRGVTI